MTTEKQQAVATADQPVDVAVAAVGDDLGVQAVAGVAVQGNQAIIVAQFADMDSAKAAYYALDRRRGPSERSTSTASWWPTPTTRARSTSRR